MDEKFLKLVLNMWDNAADSSVEQAAGDPGPCLQQTTVLANSCPQFLPAVQHIAKSGSGQA